MILLLILKVFGLVEFALDYLVTATMIVNAPTQANGGQWQLAYIDLGPTDKGWAILDDIWTLAHNTLDMLAQFSTLFPLTSATNYAISNMTVGFTGSEVHP